MISKLRRLLYILLLVLLLLLVIVYFLPVYYNTFVIMPQYKVGKKSASKKVTEGNFHNNKGLHRWSKGVVSIIVLLSLSC